MYIDKHHPRYLSLKYRELLVAGVKKGITSQAGLIAHGRGEAFDYLLGEKTHDFANEAITAAAKFLITSKKPILSVNGNVAALLPKEMAKLANVLGCPIEINLFHYSQRRVEVIEAYLKRFSNRVLHSASQKVTLPHIASNRKITLREGIAGSDCVFVPLEDGDRAQAFIGMGKKVITIDLNPLSRTAQSATITIVDNIVRALPLLIQEIQKMKRNGSFSHETRSFDNKKNLVRASRKLVNQFKKLY